MNKFSDDHKILLSHGSGGSQMHRLIREMFIAKFDNPYLRKMGDGAILGDKQESAFSTDSFVVSPLFFPGGDIGKLSVCGTVNDLVMSGAEPQYLSFAIIVEEGLDKKILSRVCDSVASEARRAGVKIVTGDIKVVEKGACDKLFINTSGIGRVMVKKELSVKRIRPGDKIIVTGNIASHGLSVLLGRRKLDLGFKINSDCAFLSGLIVPLFKKTSEIRFMRDPTRGGLAAALNEITGANNKIGIIIDEKKLPLLAKVRAACELLGIDPLNVANEGIAVLVASAKESPKILRHLRKHPLGGHASAIGRVVKSKGAGVVLNTVLGTERVIDMQDSEALPRIC